MKLDLSVLRYMEREEFRVLTAVEMGMKNHDQVPIDLVDQISKLKSGGTYKILCLLHKNTLLHHENKQYDSYRLTPMGYDYLALNALRQRDSVTEFGKQIGVGKEADIYLVSNPERTALCCKIHRLGRTSFRRIKAQRDYMLHRRSASWIYMSRLSATKEYAFMKVLYEHGFPVPEPIDHSRHIVIMRLVEGTQLNQIAELGDPAKVYDVLMGLIVRLGKVGLIHSDFNEFNLMVDEQQVVTLIDFPQMVSISHRNAKFYFERDIECVVTFFKKRFGYVSEKPRPSWAGVLATRNGTLDVLSAASGFIDAKEMAEFEKAGGLGERFGDEEGDVAEGEDSDGESGEEEEQEEEEPEGESRPKVGGTSLQEEEREHRSSRQAEALALRRLMGAGGTAEPEPEPEPEPQEGQMLASDRSGDDAVHAEAESARLDRLGQLAGEGPAGDEGGEAGGQTADVPGRVHFLPQKQGGEPDDEEAERQRAERPSFLRGGGRAERRQKQQPMTEEEQAALIRKRVAKSKSGRARDHRGTKYGNRSKAGNARNKNTKAMMRERTSER